MKKLVVAFLLLFNAFMAQSQVCTGALGDPITNAGTNFGTGISNYGPPLSAGITTYTYVNGSPDDGQYTIVKSTQGLNGGWLQNITNHTPNDPNGYMMLVNASYRQDTFFTSTINNLCPNTTYEFSAFIINLLAQSGLKPNVKFTIENNGLEIKSFTTGDIPEGSAGNWKKYGTIFTTPAVVGNITLRMTNVNPGGNGNDLAIDDIEFRACGPLIANKIDGSPQIQTNLCVGDSKDFLFSCEVTDGYRNPVYQWQMYENNVWQNIPGATLKEKQVQFSNAQAGRYLYRMLAAEAGNMNSISCRVTSEPFVITVSPRPTPVIVATTSYCEGSTIRISSDGGTTYHWTGPNGFVSAQQNLSIPNATAAMSGTYTLNVTNVNGCTGTSSISLKVLNAIVPGVTASNTEMCRGNTTQLLATGGLHYQWTPSLGLSDASIANPAASPTTTTSYTVTISNETCTAQASITINVKQPVVTDAGQDQTIWSGSATVLNGKVSGDNASFHWEPPDFLDDPGKLNPIAKPNRDIIYKLVAQSDCNVTADEVEIKVIQNIQIPNTFTPNGDGINDIWDIKGLDLIPGAELKVFERNGQLIYSYQQQKKMWDGTYKGQPVAVGTYFYTLVAGSNYENKTGWLFITR